MSSSDGLRAFQDLRSAATERARREKSAKDTGAARDELPATHSWAADQSTIRIAGNDYSHSCRIPIRQKDKKYHALASVVYLLERYDPVSDKIDLAKYIGDMGKIKGQKFEHVARDQHRPLLHLLRGVATDEAAAGYDPIGFMNALQAGAVGSGAATAAASADESKDGAGDALLSKRQRVGDASDHLKSVSDWTIADILAEEDVLSTHLSILQVPKKNFAHLLEMYHKAAAGADGKYKAGGATKGDKTSSSSSKGKEKEKTKPVPTLNPKDPNYGIPIIVVPAAVSSVINMYNAKQLLEHGIFESGEYVRLEKGVAKESLLTLNKASYYDPSKNVRYQVIDSVSQLKSEDWNRVVGVFVSGAAWQFAEWPTAKWANPAAIFENVCAFHLHFDDEALHPNIAQWRTHRLPLSKTKRHNDRSIALDFWHTLNEFVAARNATKKLNI